MQLPQQMWRNKYHQHHLMESLITSDSDSHSTYSRNSDTYPHSTYPRRRRSQHIIFNPQQPSRLTHPVSVPIKPSNKPLAAGIHVKTSSRRPHRSVSPTTGTHLPEEGGWKKLLFEFNNKQFITYTYNGVKSQVLQQSWNRSILVLSNFVSFGISFRIMEQNQNK